MEYRKNMSFDDKLTMAAQTDHFNNLGALEFRKGNIAEAIVYYTQALIVMPENDDALINLAMCYNKLGHYNEAIQYCHKAIKIDPDRAEGYRTIGDAYLLRSDDYNAVKWYRESSKRGDKSSANWLNQCGYGV